MKRYGSGRQTSWHRTTLLFLSVFLCPPPIASATDGVELLDAVLFNGQILTMDDLASVVTTVRIMGDVITATSNSIADVGPLAPDTTLIDLAGRTVIPGLIDTHVHFTRDGQAPGYRIYGVETAFSIILAPGKT